MTYDPHVIQEMAGRLYAQAARLVFLGVFLGGLVGLTAGITIALSVSLPLLGGAFVGALLGGALGAVATLLSSLPSPAKMKVSFTPSCSSIPERSSRMQNVPIEPMRADGAATISVHAAAT